MSDYQTGAMNRLPLSPMLSISRPRTTGIFGMAAATCFCGAERSNRGIMPHFCRVHQLEYERRYYGGEMNVAARMRAEWARDGRTGGR